VQKTLEEEEEEEKKKFCRILILRQYFIPHEIARTQVRDCSVEAEFLCVL
jgi:hypothetical protein